MNNLLLIFIFCILIFMLILLNNKKMYENEYSLQVQKLKRPFLNVYGVRKNNSRFLTNLGFITFPFLDPISNEKEYLQAINKGMKFLGCTSYSEFPGNITNKYDPLKDKGHPSWKFDYHSLVRGWLHVFRDPHNYIFADLPMMRLAESDFSDNAQFFIDSKKEKEFDFLYVCLKDNDTCTPGWQSEIRSFSLVQKYLDIMCSKYNLKGCLVGRIGCRIPELCTHHLTLTDYMPYDEFIKIYKKCKWTLIASEKDASPRVASESMLNNLPLFMNENILGGWQYIKEGETGEFFNENNFEEKLRIFLNNLSSYKPRDYFLTHFGKVNSGKKLKQFCQHIFDENELNFKYDDVEYLVPDV